MIMPSHAVAKTLILVGLLVVPGVGFAEAVQGSGLAQQKPQAEKPTGKKDKTKAARELSPDEKFVREKLKDFLFPDRIKFAEDGRVTLLFDFDDKNENHEEIFKPRIHTSIKSPFRWTVEGEEFWNFETGRGGIRISDRGMSFLQCWFLDDVSAEMHYFQHVNYQRLHIAAVLFASPKGKIFGTNYGSQCAYFTKKIRMGKLKGKSTSITSNRLLKIKLVVNDGKFAAYRNGRKYAEQKYSKKSFKSGRIGFGWAGSVAGTITRLEVTGKLDYKAMAKLLRKADV